MRADRRARVVVTGIGLITPLGGDRETSWTALRNGGSAARWLEFDGGRSAGAPAMRSGERGAGSGERGTRSGERGAAGAGWQHSATDSAQSVPRSAFRVPRFAFDPVVSLALDAAAEALDDARLDLDTVDRDRVGCVIGTSKGGLWSFARMIADCGLQIADCRLDESESGARQRELRLPPSDFGLPQSAIYWSQYQPHAAAACVAQRFDLRGAAICPVAACATGLVSVLRGADLIRDGLCDIVLAGSSDASLQEAILASFQRLGVLARGFDDPATACRPFDRRRNGFLVGEGAAVLVLEEYEQAIARGARPYAEWVAGGMLAECSGLTQLEPEAAGLTRLIGDVLRRAGLTSSEIDYANLHGTATIQNDICETRALKASLGRAAGKVACSSLKGGIGHLLGAAGSVELAATLLAMRDSTVPPTVNLDDADLACDLDYTPLRPRPRRIENALKLSLGFGGHLVAGVVRAI